MRLRDFFCSVCGTVIEDIWVDDLSTMQVLHICSRCDRQTLHRAVCNGGTRNRVFVTDFHSRKWSREECQFVGAGVESDGEPIVDYATGQPVEDAPRFNPEGDKINQQRDELDAATSRRNGKTPLTFDLGS